ncbi:MAG: MobA/MobL family protein [Lachnospiraceae bacterium]|nr:MobA/MobL family protein [Lachnospiraceae bacterium]
MALYHFHVDRLGRGKGYSAIAAAAYRSGTKLYDDFYGETQDYTKKGGVVMSEISLPVHAPERYADRRTLWTEVEYKEKHPRAQLAYSFDIALQNELSMEENIALAREFIQTNFVARGMVCDWAVHNPDKDGGIPNPHFHVLVPVRPLKENGEWDDKERRSYVLDENGERIRNKAGRYVFNSIPTTDWGKPETLEEWRENWAALVNAKFAEKGLSCRVDHRSYAEQGLDLIPQVHEGTAVRHMEQKGIQTDKGAWNKWVKRTYSALQNIRTALSELSEWIVKIKGEIQEEIQAEERKAAQKADKNTPQRTAQKNIPAIVDFVNEYFDERNRVAETYERGTVKAKNTNLKRRVHLCNYLMEHKIITAEDLEKRIADRKRKAAEIEESVRPKDEERKKIQANLKLLADYQKYRPVFEASQRIFFKARKAAYQEEHRKELNMYQRARRELLKVIPESTLNRMDSMDEIGAKWQQRADRLSEEIATSLSNAGREQLDTEIKTLKEIRRAVDEGLKKCGAQSGAGRSEKPQPKAPARAGTDTVTGGKKEQEKSSVMEALKQNQEEIRRREEQRKQQQQKEQQRKHRHGEQEI